LKALAEMTGVVSAINVALADEPRFIEGKWRTGTVGIERWTIPVCGGVSCGQNLDGGEIPPDATLSSRRGDQWDRRGSGQQSRVRAVKSGKLRYSNSAIREASS
jgi:hypothetical protein